MTISNFLIKKNKVLIPEEPREAHQISKLVLAIEENIKGYGYRLDKRTLAALTIQNKNYLRIFNSVLIETIQEHIGKNTEPLFKNFPNDCFEDNLEVDYEDLGEKVVLTNGQIVEIKEKEEGTPRIKEEKSNFRTLTGINREEFSDLIKTTILELLSTGVQWGQEQRENISFVLENGVFDNNILGYIEEHKIKENKYFILGELDRLDLLKKTDIFAFCGDINDIIRIVVSLNGGDVSLSSNTTIKLSNPMRMMVMGRVEEIVKNNMEYHLENSWKNRMRLVRLAEVIHPSKRKFSIYPEAVNFFNKIRSKKNKSFFFRSWESLLEDGIKRYKKGCFGIEDIGNILEKKPGVFMRRLNYVLNSVKDEDKIIILKRFNKVVDKIDTIKLIDLYGYIKLRKQSNKKRLFFIKNDTTTKTWVEKQKPLVKMNKRERKQIKEIIEEELKKRFSKFPKLSFNKIDKNLNFCPVPTSIRNTSKAKTPLPRGMRIKVAPKNNILRMHTFWKHGEKEKDIDKDIDVDLSVGCYDEKWVYKDHCSYTKLSSYNKNNEEYMVHSGDIVTGYNLDKETGENKGSSEYIDIDIKLAKKSGIRYVVMQNYDYTKQGFDTFESHTGWSWRDKFKSGEVFEPSLVENRVDITGKSCSHISIYLDLKKMVLVIVDVSMSRVPNWNTIESNSIGVTDICKETKKFKHKMSMRSLLKLHKKSRVLEKKGKIGIEILEQGFEKIHREFLTENKIKETKKR